MVDLALHLLILSPIAERSILVLLVQRVGERFLGHLKIIFSSRNFTDLHQKIGHQEVSIMDMEMIERCLAEANGVVLEDVDMEAMEKELTNALTVLKKVTILGALVKPPKRVADDRRDNGRRCASWDGNF